VSGPATRDRVPLSPGVVAVGEGEPLWFLGTLATVKLDGAATGGRFALVEVLFPRGAAPELHSHPQDETFHVLEGELSVWLGDLAKRRAAGRGSTVFAPARLPHTFRVESETARVLVLSTPAGIEQFVRACSVAAPVRELPLGRDRPRDDARIAAAYREHGFEVHGPRPPAAEEGL